MASFFRRLMIFTAVLGFLWGCESDGAMDRAVEEESAAEAPMANFLRSAAASSQDSYNYMAAVNYYHSLHNRDPDDLEALLGLARNLRYIGSAGQAAEMLEEALAEHPENVAMRAELGKALVASGRTADAIDSLNETIELAPDDWEVYSALGIAYDLFDDPGKAQESYRTALELSPQNMSVINNLALSVALSGQIDKGIAMLERTSSLPGAMPHIRQNLALMYAMKGDVKRARSLAEQDLPAEMVRHNVDVYERLSAALAGAEELTSDIVDIAPTPLPDIDVARLEEPAAEPVEPTPAGLQPAARETAAEAAATAAAGFDEDLTDAPIDGIKIELGVFPNRERAAAGLTALRDGHVDLLSGLRFRIASVAGDDSSAGYKVLAGPLASVALAADLCTKLHSRKEACRLVAP